MTIAIQIPPNGNIPSASFQEIPLICISESRTNPRRQFDEPSLAELAANIRQHGVLQSVLVRPLPEGEPGAFELVGERGATALLNSPDVNLFSQRFANLRIRSALNSNLLNYL
jgi:hypothetical protein